ncbi:maleylacetoacetate isomerase [Mycotypha africana]|uniref:maleylacetoacetate isomerase n=1 Tax=Mycotypha africana TaxID=64632 RepID=UPI002301B757|nr:maleylacetoacetate isomerase [Mycotypha africana]KAI8991543.1 maleylacetoacetate isomerase [Mycotypha africana]
MLEQIINCQNKRTPSPQCQRPILYTNYASESSWRVRIALEWKGIDYETRYINLATGEHLTEAYSEINPCRQLPCLITKTGKIITQSIAIIEYLEATYPERPIFPKSPLLKAEALSVALNIACDIQPLQAERVLNCLEIGGELRQQFCRRMLEIGLQGLESRLEKISGTYCIGEHITIADFCLVPMVFTARKKHNIDLKPYPYITKIRNTLMTLPEFRKSHPFNQPDCPQDKKEPVS